MLTTLQLSHFIIYNIFPQIPIVLQKGQLAIFFKSPYRHTGLSSKALDHNNLPPPQNLSHEKLQTYHLFSDMHL